MKYILRHKEILDWAEYVNFDPREILDWANTKEIFPNFCTISNHIMYYKQQPAPGTMLHVFLL